MTHPRWRHLLRDAIATKTAHQHQRKAHLAELQAFIDDCDREIENLRALLEKGPQ